LKMMPLVRGWKTELAPTPEQITLFMKGCGTDRFAYNWGLAWNENVYLHNQLPHERLKNPSSIDLHKELNKLKKEKFPWMYEVTKQAPQEALRHLETAFSRFFKRLGGYPNFKSRKKHGIGSFSLNDGVTVYSDHVAIPTIGDVRLKERGYLPSNHVLGATVSYKAGRWFISIQAKTAIPVKIIEDGCSGTDVGIKHHHATVSQQTIDSKEKEEYTRDITPQIKQLQRELDFLDRKISHKPEGSKRKELMKLKRQRKYKRLSDIVNDSNHKHSHYLTTTFSKNCIERLNIRGMVKNHDLARQIQVRAFGEFGRQMEYKAGWYGSMTMYPPEGMRYPSTQRCSKCGHVLEGDERLGLSDREFVCPRCGFRKERDLNSGGNLCAVALSYRAIRKAATRPNNQTWRREVTSPTQGLVPVDETSNKPEMAQECGLRV